MNTSTVQHGNFSTLASAYSKNRPGYSDFVLTSILSLFDQPIDTLDIVDIGAGTGIWTRKLAEKKPHSLTGVEPNADMFNQARLDSAEFSINWIQAGAENSKLPSNSANLISMASSFHWTEFDQALFEFHRILKEKGFFVALWNPRNLNNNPLLKEIENHLNLLKPDLKRVSSGSGTSTELLMDRVKDSPLFHFELFLEANTDKTISKEQYMGAWRSVNDIRFQLGDDLFNQFLTYIEERIEGSDTIGVSNLTRAWVFSKK